jgi:hypothetical protein
MAITIKAVCIVFRIIKISLVPVRPPCTRASADDFKGIV